MYRAGATRPQIAEEVKSQDGGEILERAIDRVIARKKKEPEWGEIPRELFVNLEVRNSAWQSMRFVECVSTAQPLDAVRALIVAKHIAPREAEVGVNLSLIHI